MLINSHRLNKCLCSPEVSQEQSYVCIRKYWMTKSFNCLERFREHNRTLNRKEKKREKKNVMSSSKTAHSICWQCIKNYMTPVAPSFLVYTTVIVGWNIDTEMTMAGRDTDVIHRTKYDNVRRISNSWASSLLWHITRWKHICWCVFPPGLTCRCTLCRKWSVILVVSL